MSGHVHFLLNVIAFFFATAVFLELEERGFLYLA